MFRIDTNQDVPIKAGPITHARSRRINLAKRTHLSDKIKSDKQIGYQPAMPDL
jgi:hypothetical protein